MCKWRQFEVLECTGSPELLYKLTDVLKLQQDRSADKLFQNSNACILIWTLLRAKKQGYTSFVTVRLAFSKFLTNEWGEKKEMQETSSFNQTREPEKHMHGFTSSSYVASNCGCDQGPVVLEWLANSHPWRDRPRDVLTNQWQAQRRPNLITVENT